MEDDMSLSGVTRPHYKAYQEYFRSANGNDSGLILSLEDMESSSQHRMFF